MIRRFSGEKPEMGLRIERDVMEKNLSKFEIR